MFVLKKMLFALSNINKMCKVACVFSKRLFVFNLETCCFHFFGNSRSHSFSCLLVQCDVIAASVAVAPSKNKSRLQANTANITNVVIYLNF